MVVVVVVVPLGLFVVAEVDVDKDAVFVGFLDVSQLLALVKQLGFDFLEALRGVTIV